MKALQEIFSCRAFLLLTDQYFAVVKSEANTIYNCQTNLKDRTLRYKGPSRLKMLSYNMTSETSSS